MSGIYKRRWQANLLNQAGEMNKIEQDSMKEALKALGIDALSLAAKIADVVDAAKNASTKLKGLELLCKVGGHLAQAPIDDRAVHIHFSPEMSVEDDFEGEEETPADKEYREGGQEQTA
jgi:hypothetical protein